MTPLLNTPDGHWGIRDVGDYDSDGCSDLTFRHLSSGQIYQLLLNDAAIK